MNTFSTLSNINYFISQHVSISNVKKANNSRNKANQCGTSFLSLKKSFITIIFFSIIPLVLWTLCYTTLSNHLYYTNHIAFAFKPMPKLIPAPIARSGFNQTVDENSIVYLLGSAIDPDPNDKLSYLWSQISGPTVILKDKNSPTASFIAPKTSSIIQLKFSLTVKDERGSSSNVPIVTIKVKHVNRLPIANAGIDQVTSPGNVIVLDGTFSKDPDKDPLKYSWQQIAGPYVKLDDANTDTPSFIAPFNISSNIDLIFKLTVYDSKNATDIDDVKVTDRFTPKPIPNLAPIANAGSYQIVNENATYVILNGSKSNDKDGYLTSYSWRQLSGPHVTLTDIHDPMPVFNIPQVSVDTPLTFALVVTDDHGASSNNSAIAHVLIKSVKSRPIPPSNKPPVANAGQDLVASPGDNVLLDGTSSRDPDNDPITYQWIQVAGPPVNLVDSNTSGPAFLAPSISSDTNLTFSLVVTDSKNATGIDYVKVTDKKPTTNQTPGYDRGCNDAKIPNLSDRYINQPGKGPRDHSPEFMRQYEKGFSDCSKGIPPGQLQNLSVCKNEIVSGIGEINTSPTGHGLRINVGTAGTPDGSHPARINVTGLSGETLCKDIELTAADQSLLFYFYPEVIPNGQHFVACITLLDTNKKSCVEGVNHQGRSSESIQLDPPI